MYSVIDSIKLCHTRTQLNLINATIVATYMLAEFNFPTIRFWCYRLTLTTPQGDAE